MAIVVVEDESCLVVIGNGAFSICPIREFVLLGCVRRIGPQAFSECRLLERVSFCGRHAVPVEYGIAVFRNPKMVQEEIEL
jgi:hypothetical protein